MTGYDDLLLEPGTTLLHIGAPKTGSTALQHAAAALRSELLERGVLYPGKELNHQKGTSHLIGRRAEAWQGELAKPEWWDALDAELRASNASRKLVSFEVVAQGDLDGVERVREAMEGPVHVVMVLRNFGQLLPSMWQQKLKAGFRKPLDRWLGEALEDETAPHIYGSDAFHRKDGLSLPERWAKVFGAENVTAVMLQKSRPEQLFGSFEGMLGLPHGILDSAPLTGYSANRGMSALEASFALHFNQTSHAAGVTRREHRHHIWMGAYDRMLAQRTPGPEEGRVGLPSWAVDKCAAAGEFLASEIERSGIRVVGDLAELTAPVKPMPEGSLVLPDALPTDLTQELMLGAVSAGLGRGPDFGTPRVLPTWPTPATPAPSAAPSAAATDVANPGDTPAGRPLAKVPASQLRDELSRRVRARLLGRR